MGAIPAEIVKDILVSEGYTFGGNGDFGLHIGKPPGNPDAVIAIMDTGGLEPNPKWLVDYPSVQLLVRGKEGGYSIARQNANTLKGHLLGRPSETVGSDRVVQINQIGDIASLGFDESNRVMFSLNFQLIVEPATDATTNRTAL